MKHQTYWDMPKSKDIYKCVKSYGDGVKVGGMYARLDIVLSTTGCTFSNNGNKLTAEGLGEFELHRRDVKK